MKNIILITLLLSSCTVGRNFKSPEVNVPVSYMNSSDTTPIRSTTEWWRNFNDPILDSLMNIALTNNKNLATTIKNIEIARLTAISSRAAAYPSLSLNGSAAASYDYQTKIAQSYTLKPTISWEIDLWGKIRRQAEAAGADFKATEYETAAVRQSLESQFATTYFTALSYKMALEIARNTYKSRAYTTQLMDSMFRYGAISEVDLQQSRTSMQTAAVAVEQYDRDLRQTLLSLNLLMGNNPQTLPLGNLRTLFIEIPVGLPSSLLENRPDVMQAYYGVQQANAMVGVATANRLPSLTLTGSGGLATSIVSDIATSRPISWSAAASLIAPILEWGTLKRNQQIAKIKTEQALLAYEQSVIIAINEVEQALVAVETYNREVQQSRAMVESSLKTQQLTAELYKVGQNSYLDLLDAERTLLSAQLQYAQTIMMQIDGYITLYTALGLPKQ